MGCSVSLLRRRPPVMGNDELSFAQELVGHANAFVKQAAGILSKIEYQTFEIPHLIEGVGDFFFSGLVEATDVHVPDPRLDHEVQINAVPRNLVANHGELERLIGTFAQDGDVDRRTFRSLQHVGDIASIHVVGGFSVDRDDDVAWADSGPVSGRPDEGRDNDDFVIARAYGHAYAVVFAALVFAQKRV